MLKEAVHIKWENPTLNKQLKHADLTLSLWYHSLSLFYIYVYMFFVLITFCVMTIVIISIFTIFFPVLSVVLAQVLFHVSCILKLYVNFSKSWFVSRFNLYVIACINSTELTNEFTTEDDRWTIETCLVLNFSKVVVHFLKKRCMVKGKAVCLALLHNDSMKYFRAWVPYCMSLFILPAIKRANWSTTENSTTKLSRVAFIVVITSSAALDQCLYPDESLTVLVHKVPKTFQYTKTISLLTV